MSIIFVDFDDVVIDTARFKKDYFKMFSKFGISPRNGKLFYEESKRIAGHQDPRVMTRLAHERFPEVSASALLRALTRFRHRAAPRYVFPFARRILARLAHTHRLELLTMGQISGQRAWVRASGMEKYFSRCHFVRTNPEKVAVIRSRTRRESPPVFFIDNLKANRDFVKKNFPSARVFASLVSSLTVSRGEIY